MKMPIFVDYFKIIKGMAHDARLPMYRDRK